MMHGETEMVVTKKREKVPTKPLTASAARLQDIEAQADDGEDEEQKKWRDMERTIFTRIIQGTAGASIVFNIVAMAIEGGVTIGMGMIALIVGSLVIYFQFMIQDTDSTFFMDLLFVFVGCMPPLNHFFLIHCSLSLSLPPCSFLVQPLALRMVQNELRHSVNDFSVANMELSNNTTQLEQELVPLKECEVKLERIAQQSNSTATKLRDLVKDNQKTLDEMNVTLQEDVIQDVMEIVLQAEQDTDGKFTDPELKRLILRLSGLPSITVDKEKFMKRAQLHRSISDVFGMLKTIHDDKVPPEEQIITISATPKDLVVSS